MRRTADGYQGGGNDWCLVVVTGFVIFMAQLDATIVNVALPTIQQSFHTAAGVTEWVVLAYPLSLIALTLLAGRWLDDADRGKALIAAAAVFATASGAAAAAPGLAFLLFARVVQGAAAAALLAIAPVMAVDAVDDAAHGRALGVVSTLAPLGAMCGPVLGGLLLEHLGWRTIFLVNIPVALASSQPRRRGYPGAAR